MRFKLSLALIALLTSSALLAAYMLQHYMHMEPCTYCILIRYGMVIALMMSLFVGFANRLAPKVFYDMLLVPLGLVAASSAWLTLRLMVPDAGCGKDALALMLNQWSTAKYLPEFFKVTGMCGDTNAYLLNIHLAHWSLGLSAALGLVWLFGRVGSKSRPKAQKEALVC